MAKKKVIGFIPADKANTVYATGLINSIRKFHPKEEFPVRIYDNPNPQDKDFWYRATPILMKELIKEYELVIKLDADQICFGSLDHILNGSYQVGTVLNINRVDPTQYGLVQLSGIPPNEYYNNGLVAVKDASFVDRWYDLCFTKYFDRFQYREQDLLNLVAHFGGYDVVCFDHYTKDSATFNGLVAKGETKDAYLKDGQVIVPQGKDNYPDRDTVLKLWHTAAGSNTEKKVNYRIWFPDEIHPYISWLISDSKEAYK